MALPLALALAPIALQLGTSIFAGSKARRMQKQLLKQNAIEQQQLQAQLQMMTQQNTCMAGGMTNSYLSPMGMGPQNYGPMGPGGLPPGFA